MNSILLLSFIAPLLQIVPAEVSLATIPPDSRVDLALLPNGEVEIRREDTITTVKVEIDQIAPLTAFRPDFRSWVVWAVSPEGEFENLGELAPDGRGGQLETVTSLTRLGILVTAEPHFRVEMPGSTVAFRSGPARDRDDRVDPLNVEVGHADYDGISLPPQGSIHPRISQARLALQIAEDAAVAETPSAALRQARVALDSMEELLRRDTPVDVILTYANDSIRLSALAMRQARIAADSNRLVQANQTTQTLEQSLSVAEEDRARAENRERDATRRINELLAELESERSANRALTLERDAAERNLASAETEIRDLRDPWPPLMSALIYSFAARETPRGLVVTLPANAFERGDLTPDAREWLARLGGALAFGEVPEVWVEGHSAADEVEESEERATLVRDYLVATGLPDSMVHSEGLGALAPIPGTEDSPDDAINERVEIIVREFGSL